MEESEVLDCGRFEIYPNRDSLSYRKTYGFDEIPTILRGTFRRPGYCKAWNVFVQLGMTDDSYELSNVDKMTYREFINAFLPYHLTKTVEEKLVEYLPFAKDKDIQTKLAWLGIFEDKAIGLKSGTPAQILQHLLEEKWALGKDDIDMIVMQHKIVYELNRKLYEVTSSLVVKGKDTKDTAMSITVGMPVAIATKLLLQGKLFLAGVQVPNTKCMYEPIMEELENVGIRFIEEVKEIV